MMWRHALRLFERSREVENGQSRRSGKCFETDVLLEVGLHVLTNAPQRSRRQPTASWSNRRDVLPPCDRPEPGPNMHIRVFRTVLCTGDARWRGNKGRPM